MSCISRAGCPSGKLSAVKLYQSVSMSGPSAMVNPMSEKIAVISSQTWLMGWMRPVAVVGRVTGRVMSRRSLSSRASSAFARKSLPLASISPPTSFLSPLIAGPALFRSSGAMVPSDASNAETEPFLPSADTRTASSAASSAAAAMAALRSVRRRSISSVRLIFGPWRRAGKQKAPRRPGQGGARLSLRPRKRLGAVRLRRRARRWSSRSRRGTREQPSPGQRLPRKPWAR